MVVVRNYIGPATTKREKIEIIHQLWPSLLGRPRKVSFVPSQSDRQPINAALDLALVVAAILQESARAMSLIHRVFGTLAISCDLCAWPDTLQFEPGRRRLLKRDLGILKVGKGAFDPELVHQRIQQISFSADFQQLSRAEQENYATWCPPGTPDAAAQYVDEMEIFFRFKSVNELNPLYAGTMASDDARRFDFIIERAGKLGWRPFKAA